MGVATKSIVLEDVLDEIFSYLPDMSFDVGGEQFPVRFDYGDEVDLNHFLANRETSTTYPLIWLLYPYSEKHTRTGLEVGALNFIFAVDTNSSMENRERMQETFGKILMPLLFNFRQVLQKAGVININNNFDVVKHPNYSKTEARDENTVIAIWDALKVTTEGFTVIDTCLKEIKF